MITVVSVSFFMPVSILASNTAEPSGLAPGMRDYTKGAFIYKELSDEDMEEYRDLFKRVYKVGYVDGFYPFCYDEGGEFTGLTRRMFDDISRKYGIRFIYMKYKKVADANKALNAGVIDIVAYYGGSKEALEKYDLVVTEHYVKAPLVIIKKENPKKDIADACATVHYLYEETTSAINLDKYAIEFFSSEKACLNAVANDHAKITVCNGYLSQYLLSNDFDYNELSITAVLDVDYLVCAAVRAEDTRLLDFMNKILPVIDDRTINEFLLESTQRTAFDIGYFVNRYGWILIVAMFVIMMAVVTVSVRTVKSSRRLQKLLYMDSQMHIWNLNYLRHIGANRLLNSDNKSQYAICCINLGQFRRVNLVYGFERGTAILKLLISAFDAKLDRKTDIYCRDHGDKFVIMVKFNDDAQLKKRLRDIIEDADRRIYDETDTHIPIQIGVYKLEPDVDISLALDYSLQAMGAIRDSKVSEIKFYDAELKQKIKESYNRQRELNEKSIKDDFLTYYQAKVDIKTGKIVGAEALVRMKNADDPGRVISPGFFVPYYEQTGFITEIDFFICDQVCRMLSDRIAAGKKAVTVSVNFSRLHFVKKEFPDRLEAVITKYGLPRELIEVEITETLAVEQIEDKTILETVDELIRRDIRISIDDFGSGYSSLGIIERIPASVIKLDRSFLLNHKDRERQITLMRGIVSMAGDLNAQIVCEGVETEKDIELMKLIGASVAQGYYYSKPAPQDAFLELLDKDAE